MAAEVLNSSSVFRLNFCAKLNICASISATSPSRKTLAVIVKMEKTVKLTTQFQIKMTTYFGAN
jgi:hypothetical protein